MRVLLLLLISMAIGITQTAFAGVDTETDENDVILAGHDAVAYQTQNKAVLGSANYTAEYNGAIYRFESAANRDMFTNNSAKYAPVYGGYCAFGVSLGKKFDIDGKAFKVVDGRLYVNKNVDVLKTWVKDIPGNIKKADVEWPAIKDFAPSEL